MIWLPVAICCCVLAGSIGYVWGRNKNMFKRLGDRTEDDLQRILDSMERREEKVIGMVEKMIESHLIFSREQSAQLGTFLDRLTSTRPSVLTSQQHPGGIDDELRDIVNRLKNGPQSGDGPIVKDFSASGTVPLDIAARPKDANSDE